MTWMCLLPASSSGGLASASEAYLTAYVGRAILFELRVMVVIKDALDVALR